MLIDNKKNGRVGDVLKQNINENSRLSIISGYFTLYAFAELKKELNKVTAHEAKIMEIMTLMTS